MLIIFPPVRHLRFNFAYDVFLTHKKVLFLSNRIHQSFPLLFCLERPANLSMFKKAQITQVYKASFQTYLRKKIFGIFVRANHNVSWSYPPPTSSAKPSLSQHISTPISYLFSLSLSTFTSSFPLFNNSLSLISATHMGLDGTHPLGHGSPTNDSSDTPSSHKLPKGMGPGDPFPTGCWILLTGLILHAGHHSFCEFTGATVS